MAITVKHNKVSTVPDGDDTSVVRPSDWNADHTLTGLGTMAEQNSNNVNITGGSITGVTGLGDVVGPASATDNAVARFDQTTGKLIQNSVVTVGDTGQIAGVLQEDFTSTTAPAYLEGRVWYDSTEKALAFYNDSSSIAVHVGQDLIVKVINNTGSTIPNGSPVYITSISSGQTYPNVALAKADVAATSAVIGLTNGSIANGAIGYVTSQGTIDNVNTGSFTVGQVLYLSPYSAGQLMNTIPPTGITVQVGVATFINSSIGHIYVKQTTPLAVPASIITGQVAVANGGTGASTASGARTNLGLGTIATQDASAVAITGGTINGTTIGATTPSSIVGTTITGQTGVLRGTGQNLLQRSQTFSNAVYSSSTATRTDNQTIAPDGTSTGALIQATAVSFGGLVRQFLPAYVSNTTYTISIFAKAGTSNFLGLRPSGGCVAGGGGDNYCYFNLSNGTATAITPLTGTVVSVGATNVGNGWYRCFVVYTTATVSNSISDFAIVNSVGATQPTPAGTETIFAWGFQLELGSTANTYIPTTTTAVYGTPTLSFSGVSTLGLESNGALFLQPAGTGAIQAQQATSTTAGGNVRGANAVDWQTSRNNANQVASSAGATISGGVQNISSGIYAVAAGGVSNGAGAFASVVSGGWSNFATGNNSAIVGGYSNTAAGYFNFIGSGSFNSGTANTAVTTQSGTMNATTAVTLSGSNANIKVGQYIVGTSIAQDTYVAAISGTALTLSKNASGSSTSTLSFFTPHGVVVGGGNNQATGSYSFIGGGGDAGTAANRNVASGDWSFVGGGTKNSATNSYSSVLGGQNNSITTNHAFIGGGINNSVSNSYASVVGGYQNTASGANSVVTGGTFGTTRSITGFQTFTGNDNALGSGATGTIQAGLLVLGKQTTDATATVLTSNNSGASGTNQVILPNNSAYLFKATVISGVTGGGNTSGWKLEGVIKRGANAASTTIVGTVTTTLLAQDAGASGWVIAATADTTNGGLRITFTGQASTTIRTVCKVETTEVTY